MLNIVAKKSGKGNDFSISILENKKNISGDIALKLHRIYQAQCEKHGLEILSFGNDTPYTLHDTGLAFWLRKDKEALEFYTPLTRTEKKRIDQLSTELPELLRNVGINDETVLSGLKASLIASASNDCHRAPQNRPPLGASKPATVSYLF